MSIFEDGSSPEGNLPSGENIRPQENGHQQFPRGGQEPFSIGQPPDPEKDTRGLKEVRKELGTKMYDPKKLGAEIDGLKRTLRLAPYNQPTETEITAFRQQQEEERQRIEKEKGFFGRMFGPKKQEGPSQEAMPPVINVEKEPLPLEQIQGKLQRYYDGIVGLIQTTVRDAAARGVPMSFSKIGIRDQVENISAGNKDVEGSLRTIRRTIEFVDKYYFHRDMDYFRNPMGRAFNSDLRLLSDQENKLRLKRLEEMEKNPRLEIPKEVEQGRGAFLKEIQEARDNIAGSVRDPYARGVPIFMLDVAQELAGDDTIVDPQAFGERKETINKILDNTYLFYLHRRRTS